MPNDRASRSPFRGFRSPNYTQVPDELFDELLPELSGAELKVLLYIIRRTFGFKRDSDSISLSQMLNGIQGRDGQRLDRGAGVSKPTLLQALRSLEERQIIQTERRRSAEKGDEPTVYKLRFANDGVGGQKIIRPVVKEFDHGGGKEASPPGWSKNLTTQETDVGQTDFDHSNFEGARDQLTAETAVPARRALTAPAADADAKDHRRRTDASGLKALGEILAERAMTRPSLDIAAASAEHRPTTPTIAPRRRRPTGDPEARERLRAFLQDFARELGDEAPLASTITRVLAIFTVADISPERWGDLLYQARGLTQEHTAQIRKLAGDGEGGIRRKNKMPYFLATLEQLVGLRPESTDADPSSSP
jgi:hypothetical protein